MYVYMNAVCTKITYGINKHKKETIGISTVQLEPIKIFLTILK